MTKKDKDLLDYVYGKMQDALDYMVRNGVDSKDVRLYMTIDPCLGFGDGLETNYISVDLVRFKDREKGVRKYTVYRTSPTLTDEPNYFEFEEKKHE